MQVRLEVTPRVVIKEKVPARELARRAKYFHEI